MLPVDLVTQVLSHARNKTLVRKCDVCVGLVFTKGSLLFSSCATCSPLAGVLLSTIAIDDTVQPSREHSTLLLSRLVSRFVERLHTVCISNAL